MNTKSERVNTPWDMLKENMGFGATEINQHPKVRYSISNLVDFNTIISAMAPLSEARATALQYIGTMHDYTKCAYTVQKLASAPELPQTKLKNFKEISGTIAPETLQKAHNLTWNSLNFIAASSVTCATIVSIQSPVKTMLVSLTKDNRLVPNFSGGALGLVRILYKGTSNALSGSAIRTSYVTGAKEAKPHEETTTGNTTYVATITLGELAVTQISESLSTLKKADILPENFNWKTKNNFYQLMKGGFSSRYLSGLVNISALTLLSDKIAANLPLENQNLAYTFGGAVSGMVAGIFSYPFATMKDAILVQATVKEGKLINMSAVTFTEELYRQLKADPKSAMKKCFKQAAKQLPIRMGLTAAIFSIVSGLGEALGSEPLKAIAPGMQPKQAQNSQGFFKTAPAVINTKVELKPESTLSESAPRSKS